MYIHLYIYTYSYGNVFMSIILSVKITNQVIFDTMDLNVKLILGSNHLSSHTQVTLEANVNGF